MEETKVLPVRIEITAFRELRKLAYLTEQPMAQIIRDAVNEELKKQKKVLTNSDIAI